MVKKQFIAGAKCPRCNAMDKIRACRSATREWMECVACGYEEERPTEGASSPEQESHEGAVVKWSGQKKD